jgi:hypothetical protein
MGVIDQVVDLAAARGGSTFSLAAACASDEEVGHADRGYEELG